MDIDRMRQAASYLVGLHDFRNLCKVDPAKQITNFVRRIFHASIDEVSDVQTPSFLGLQSDVDNDKPKVYCISVNGSAFLWHQVRHLAAVLFLVGQRLEEPEIVRDLLNTETVKGKPMYELADDAPLVLWDCVFPEQEVEPGTDQVNVEGLKWVHALDEGGPSATDLMDSLWVSWRRAKMDEVLAAGLFDVAAAQSKEKTLPQWASSKGSSK